MTSLEYTTLEDDIRSETFAVVHSGTCFKNYFDVSFVAEPEKVSSKAFQHMQTLKNAVELSIDKFNELKKVFKNEFFIPNLISHLLSKLYFEEDAAYNRFFYEEIDQVTNGKLLRRPKYHASGIIIPEGNHIRVKKNSRQIAKTITHEWGHNGHKLLSNKQTPNKIKSYLRPLINNPGNMSFYSHYDSVTKEIFAINMARTIGRREYFSEPWVTANDLLDQLETVPKFAERSTSEQMLMLLNITDHTQVMNYFKG